MKVRQIAFLFLFSVFAAGTHAEDKDPALDRFLEADLIGYLAITKGHSSEALAKLLKYHQAVRVSRFVDSGYSQDVSSVIYTVVETSDKAWVDVSWIVAESETPKVYRTPLHKGDLKAWRYALAELDHENLQAVDDIEGQGTLDGRSIWFAVKSKEGEFQYGFPNPSYSKLPSLQSIRFVDLLVSDWSLHSYGPAQYDYEPNPGTTRLKSSSEQGGADQPTTAPESKSEGNDKPKPESEVRPR